jgi:hypothetical protein
MACASVRLSAFHAVWSKGSTTDSVVHAITEALSAAEIREVRPSFEIRQASGACQIRVAVQYSDDGRTWDAATEFGPAARPAVAGRTARASWTSLRGTARARRGSDSW